MISLALGPVTGCFQNPAHIILSCQCHFLIFWGFQYLSVWEPIISVYLCGLVVKFLVKAGGSCQGFCFPVKYTIVPCKLIRLTIEGCIRTSALLSLIHCPLYDVRYRVRGLKLTIFNLNEKQNAIKFTSMHSRFLSFWIIWVQSQWSSNHLFSEPRGGRMQKNRFVEMIVANLLVDCGGWEETNHCSGGSRLPGGKYLFSRKRKSFF